VSRRSFIDVFIANAVLALAIATVLAGCARAGPESVSTAAPTTSTAPGTTNGTLVPGTGTVSPSTSGGPLPTETTISSDGATDPGGQTRTLTFLGSMTKATFQALREMVNAFKGDGEKVLRDIEALAAGPPIEVPLTELDAVGGIGFAAGASTSQPIGIAVDDQGNQVMVFAYTVMGKPDATTIVGYERQTNMVKLVEGPLPITNSTQNVTTIPSAK
jgi:hypothetical protein